MSVADPRERPGVPGFPLFLDQGRKIFFEDRPPSPPPLSQGPDPALNIVSRSSICCMCCGSILSLV